MTTTFLGIPVDGDIVRGDKRPNQRPLDELSPILQAILDDPTVTEFGWRQYTPYFNDGEPCVFGTHGIWVRTTADDADADPFELDVDDAHPTLGEREYVRGQGRSGTYTGPDEARYDRCMALDRAIGSGQFDDVLLEAFGDHADVTVARSGITVEFYEHD